MVDSKQVERRTIWTFEIEDSHWSWVRRRPDGSQERSTHSFGSLQECGRNATQHGYGEWKGPERRRSELGRDILRAAAVG